MASESTTAVAARSLSVTPAVSSSVICRVTPLTASAPTAAVNSRFSASSSTSLSMMVTSADAEISPTPMVNAAGSV